MNIQIDTSSLANAFSGVDEKGLNDIMDYTVKEITARFAQEWENEANRTLKSSRAEYISNINVVDEGFAKGAVVLTGWLPNAVESGIPSFDEKSGFFNSPKAKISKEGHKYLTIPFAAGVPGSLAENFNGGIMPQEVHDIVSERNEDEPLQKYDLKNLPAKMREPQKKTIKLPESKSFKEYQHKHSIYEGLTKKKDNRTGQNSYVSFRRVSENTASYEYNFIHPGITAYNLCDKALQEFNISLEVGNILDTVWLKNGK